MTPDRTPDRSPGDATPQTARRAEHDAWGAFGLVVSGVLFWGVVGGLIGRATGSDLPVVAGLLLGMGGGLFLVWFRYGRA
jgi:ATP synthase protein I